MTTLQKVKRAIADRQLLDRGDSVLVALSGGPDSVAMMHLLTRLRRSMKLTLHAVYINHQIRPRAAKKEERFCQQLCDDLKVPLTVVHEDVPAFAKKEKLGLEEAAREIRYATFDRLATENGFDRVALGHHADDQVETILFRLFRGTGPSGLIGMPARRGKIIRPLLDLTRVEIMMYLTKNSLDWCEDTSNKSLKFKRNYIRHRLLPALRRELNPQVGKAILSLADTLGAEEEYLDSVVERAFRKCLTISPGGKFTLALKIYRGYATWLRRRLLRRCLKATWLSEPAPAKEVVERLDQLAFKASGSVSLPRQTQATVYGTDLLIYARRKQSVGEVFEPGKRLNLSWPEVRFTSRVITRGHAKPVKKARSMRVWLDWDKLAQPMEVRSIRPGDRFRPLGMKGHKKVSDYLTDRKLPRTLRDEVLLLCDRQGPIWLVGYEIDERVKIDNRTKRVLTVGFSYRKTAGRSAV